MANPVLQVQGVVYESDATYSFDTDQARLAFTVLDGTSIIDRLLDGEIRYETSYSAVSATNFVSWKGDGGSQVNRGIMVGDFLYEGRELKSGVVTKNISWSHNLQDNTDIISVVSLENPYTISNANDPAAWEAFYEHLRNEGIVDFSYDSVNWTEDVLNGETVGWLPPENDFSVADFLASSDGSLYFKEDWYSTALVDNLLPDIDLDIGSQSSGSASSATYTFNGSVTASAITNKWLSEGQSNSRVYVFTDAVDLDIQASSWSGRVRLKSVVQAGSSGGQLEAPQIQIPSPRPTGSVINGSAGRDIILAKAGWDVIDGRAGDDYIRAGNGRDIITGGLGNDELWGDFGWNTYTSEKDGYRDLIAIKSDEYLINWLNGRAGNNPNGEKADIIEGLDSNDVIKILGVGTEDLTFGTATAHGVSGIGIYGRGALEAVYTGGDLSIDQIKSITTGDANFPGGGYGVW